MFWKTGYALTISALTLLPVGASELRQEAQPPLLLAADSKPVFNQGLQSNSKLDRKTEQLNAQIKNGMHRLQTIIETYAVDHDGNYPASLKVLYTEAVKPGREYFAPVTNPVSKAVWKQGGSYTGVVLEKALTSSCRPGLIYLQLLPKQKTYLLRGCGANGRAITDKGKIMTLSNM